MKTFVESPLGHLSRYPKLNMELEMTGDHHTRLLAGNVSAYERVVASVIQDLIGEADVSQLTLSELFYYFMLAKGQTIGPTWHFEYVCPKIVRREGREVRCDMRNKADYSISKKIPSQLPAKFKIPMRKIKLVSVGSIQIPPEEEGKEFDCYFEPVTLEKEFDLIDFYTANGTSREDILRGANGYKYITRRIALGLRLAGDVRYLEKAAPEEIIEILDKHNSMRLKEELISDQYVYDRLGYPMTVDVTCPECKGVTRMALPFLAGLLVQPGPIGPAQVSN